MGQFCQLRKYSQSETIISASGKLRQLTDSSKLVYISTPLRALSFCLRLFQKSPNISGFLLWRGAQKNAIETILSNLQCHHAPNHTDILPPLHQFLVATFDGSVDIKCGVASVLEQCLLLLSIDNERGWRRPTSIKRRLKHILYLSRMVKTHAAFLGGFHKPYSMPSNETPAESILESVAKNAATVLGSIPQFDFTRLQDHLEDRKSLDDSDSILCVSPSYCRQSFILSHCYASHFLTNSTKSLRCRHGGGQMQRIATSWSVCNKAIAAEEGSTALTWSPCGRSLSFTAPYAQLDIDFVAHSEAAEEVCIRGIDNQLRALARLFSADDDFIESLDEIDIGHFADDGRHDESLFHLEANAHTLTPLVKKLKDSSSQLNLQGKQCALQGAQRFMEELLRGIVATSGLPMRAQQYAMLQYEPFQNFRRNIYVVGGAVVISYPRAKQWFLHYYDAHWQLPERVGRALLLYLGVLRPVEISLAYELVTHEALDEMSTFVFVTPFSKRTTTVIWTGKRVNNTLRSDSSTIRGECRVWRHVIQAFLHQHIPEVVALRDDKSRDTQIAVSQAFQRGLLGNGTPPFQSSMEPLVSDTGLLLARRLTRAYAAGLTPKELSGRARRILDNVSDADFEVLLKVSSALIFAGRQPGPFSVAPLHGFPLGSIEVGQSLVSVSMVYPLL